MIRVRVRGRNPTPGTIQTSPFALDVLELADTFFRTNLRLSMVAGCQESCGSHAVTMNRTWCFSATPRNNTSVNNRLSFLPL